MLDNGWMDGALSIDTIFSSGPLSGQPSYNRYMEK